MSDKGEQVFCFCGIVAVVRCSWTDDNPGRRFYGCYKGKEPGKCNFFEWRDPPMCERSIQIIPGLLRKKNEIEADLSSAIQQQISLEAQLESVRVREKILWAVIMLLCSFIVYALMFTD